MSSLRILGVMIWALSTLMIGGCSQNSSREPAMRIGTNVWPGYEPFYLARSQGNLNENEYRLVEYSNSTDVISAFRNGLIDAVALTLDETLYLLESGFDVEVVLVTDISHGGDVIISQNNITSFRELKGARVGIENNALGAYVMSRALEINGMSKSDITPVPLSVDEHLRAFKEKQVEAVVTFDPVRSKLLEEGGHVLFDSRQIPGEVLDVLVVSKQFLRGHPQQVNTLLNVWFDTLAFMEKDLDAASQIISRRQKLDPALVAASYAGLRFPDRAENRSMLCGSQTLHDTTLKLERIMRENSLLQTDVDTTKLFNYGSPFCRRD